MKHVIFSFLILIPALLFSQAPDWAWATSIHGNSHDPINFFESDTYGNHIIGGSFNSPAIMIRDTMIVKIPPPWNNSAYCAVLDDTGKLKWAKSFYSKNDSYYNSVFIKALKFDPQGNIYLIGGWYGSGDLYFDTVFISGEDGAYSNFILCFNPEGELSWYHLFEDDSEFSSLVKDGNGGFYLLGRMIWACNQMDLGDTILVNIGNENQAFILHLNASHQFDWAKLFVGYSDGISGESDSEGNLYFSGAFEYNTYTIDTIVLNNIGFNYRENFIGKCDIDGNILWAKVPSIQQENISSFVVKQNGMEVLGYFYIDYVDFENDTLFLLDDFYTYYRTTYNSEGVLQGAEYLPSDFPDSYSISSPDDGIYAVGILIGDSIWNGIEYLIDSSGYGDPGIIYYDHNFNVTGGFSIPMEYLNSIPKMSRDPFGNVNYVGSLSADKLIFGADTIENYQLTTQVDFFIACSNNCQTELQSLLVDGNILTAAEGIEWRWYKNDLIIPGAVSKYYTPTTYAIYRASALQADGCTIWSSPLVWPEENQENEDEMIPLIILPNPSAGTIYIHIPVPFDKCEIYTIQGQLLKQWNGGMEFHESTTVETAGIYLCRVTAGNMVSTLKFIIR